MNSIVVFCTLCIFLRISDAAMSDAEKTICLDTHNNLRAGVKPTASNMQKMQWNATVAAIAQGWADKCTMKHSTGPEFAGLGENLYFFASKTWDVKSAVEFLYAEVEYYTYKTQACSDECGHYTQVVWANSHQLGCGAKYCPNYLQDKDRPSWYFVCEYGPAGNGPTHPYKSGTPCSACPTSAPKCENNLCVAASGGGNNGGLITPPPNGGLITQPPKKQGTTTSGSSCLSNYFYNQFMVLAVLIIVLDSWLF